jgi:hypothetical protein
VTLLSLYPAYHGRRAEESSSGNGLRFRTYRAGCG